MPNPENPQEQNNENIEQQPISPENDWVSKVSEDDFKKMTPEEKQEALDNLAKELKEKYEHVGPDAEWGANDVEPERGIIKKEKGNVEIQSRDEFLDEYLEQYSKAKFGDEVNDQGKEQEKTENDIIKEQSENQNVYQEQLKENEYENIAEKTLNREDLETSTKEGVDNLSAEQLKEIEKDYLDQQETMKGTSDQEQYINEQFKGEKDDYQEQLKENEYENIAEKTKDQENFEYPRSENPDEWTEEQKKEYENEILENQERIEKSSQESSIKEQLQEPEIEEEDKWPEKETKFKKAMREFGEGSGKFLRNLPEFLFWKAIGFIGSLPSRFWDAGSFFWTWGTKILERQPSWGIQEIERRFKKSYENTKKDWDKLLGR